MDIAAMSMSMASAKIQQQVSVSMAKKSMDTAEIQMQGIVDMLNQVQPPSVPGLGNNIDTYA